MSTFQGFGPRGAFFAEAPENMICEGAERGYAHRSLHTSHEPFPQPLSPLPAHSTRSHMHIPPLSASPVCSWQAKCARPTPGLPMTPGSIVRISTSCASACACFLLTSTSRAARGVPVSLPGAGRCPEAQVVGVRVGCRRFGGSKLVCPLRVYVMSCLWSPLVQARGV